VAIAILQLVAYLTVPGIIGVGGVVLVLYLEYWWHKRPLSPRRKLKLQRKVVDQKIAQAMTDMEQAARGTYIRRGPWWS
jgi:hypothetical protein